MASVTSLDQDMKKLRLSRYTQSTANEARAWVEDTLGRSLPPDDLLEALRDGVALCELANLVLPAPGIKFKKSAMPFVQMENISHFLRACEMPPLHLPAHDRFLTVDLYESKDPAQVLQCLGAFSRQAHAANPSRFPTTIGPKKSGIISPTTTGNARPAQARAMSPSVTGGSTGSHTSTTRSPAPVSSWSSKADQGATAPAWNPVMYGYMGGADQAKQGVSFGSRRQITSASPVVPSLADKERRRKEKEAEEEKALQERRAQRAEEERLAVEAEQRQWEEETTRAREEERLKIEAQKREWEAQERQWQEAEEKRKREESALKKPPEKPRTPSGNVLRGQTLSQYQKEQAALSGAEETPEQLRVKELEQQLAEARERERQYQLEREQRLKQTTADRPSTAKSTDESELSWVADDRETIRRHAQAPQESIPSMLSKLSESVTAAEMEPEPARPLPEPIPTRAEEPPAPVAAPTPIVATTPDVAPMPVIVPATVAAPTPVEPPRSSFRSPFARPANRTEAFLSSSPAPQISVPRVSSTAETGDTANEQSMLRDQRVASQQKTQAGAWASKSLLEREMERERERQREWEAGQQATKSAARDATQGSGPGQTWDVNTYGFTAGDSQNKGSSSGSGIAFGGRRQIIGPRPQP